MIHKKMRKFEKELLYIFFPYGSPTYGRFGEILKTLSKREFDILKRRSRGWTEEEIGVRHGLSSRTIWEIKTLALRKIHKLA